MACILSAYGPSFWVWDIFYWLISKKYLDKDCFLTNFRLTLSVQINDMKINKEIPFYLLFLAAFLFMAGPQLFSDGMFVDGVVYASVSKNLANGLGSFWVPVYTATLYPEFIEHPPLVFGMQSLFFSLFGNSIFTERIYSLIMFLMISLIIIRIWKEMTGNYQMAWIPLLLWISIPLAGWGISNNMLENTLTIFVCLAALFYLVSMKRNKYLFITLASLCIIAGFLSKGFVAFFPLSVPFFAWLAAKKISSQRFVLDTLIMVFVSTLVFVTLFLIFPASYDSIIKYIDKQVVGSLKNVQTVENRFYILYRLFTELIPMLALVTIILLIRWFKSKREIIFKTPKGNSLMLLLVGLSGVVPIMISLKQSGYYMIPAFPFFALGLGLLIIKDVEFLFKKINFKLPGFKTFYALSTSVFLLALILTFLSFDKTGRDKDKLHDIYMIMDKVPENTTIAISYDLFEDWGLHAYFMRLANISLDPDKTEPYMFYISKTNNRPEGFRPLDINTKNYKLYLRR